MKHQNSISSVHTVKSFGIQNSKHIIKREDSTLNDSTEGAVICSFKLAEKRTGLSPDRWFNEIAELSSLHFKRAQGKVWTGEKPNEKKKKMFKTFYKKA